MVNKPFAGINPTPVNHFKLYFYAAVIHLMEQLALSLGSVDAVTEKFSFLAHYRDEIETQGAGDIDSGRAGAWWSSALAIWERSSRGHLPLRAIAESRGLDYPTLVMLFLAGMAEEDPRFGYLFETAHGVNGQHSITQGLLHAWFSELENARRRARLLEELGLLRTVASGGANAICGLQVPPMVWEAMRGEIVRRPAPWAIHEACDELPRIDDLILSEETEEQVRALPLLFANHKVSSLIVRGPQHNGRRTLFAGIAAMLGRGLLEISAYKAEDERWRLVGVLATLLHAMPVLRLDLAPGETVEVPPLPAYEGPVGFVLTRYGNVIGPVTERAMTLVLPMPDEALRRRHWERVFEAEEANDEPATRAAAERLRMTGGNLRRTARLAISCARLEQRTHVCPANVQQAARMLNRHAMESLALRVNAHGNWEQLAAAPQTLEDLQDLESRCRYRERLCLSTSTALTANLNAGVRALFSGPSGTGKTLAAQVLAARLQRDLYRLDLSTVVNKYIGETEKNLNQVLARAEDLDVVLLLDEGDALLTQRTVVQSSNDRYANLETNYLLQRLESFEGILIVTTNAADRIDRAFQRRMDVVVEFRPPEGPERWSIWKMHLPGEHRVDDVVLSEIAGRCVMTGGQIRNAALHASVLALEDGGALTSAHVETAVQREYRKLGAVCPLRHPAAAMILERP